MTERSSKFERLRDIDAARALSSIGNRSCLACGRAIGARDEVIRIHGHDVHLRCAVYRRRRAPR